MAILGAYTFLYTVIGFSLVHVIIGFIVQCIIIIITITDFRTICARHTGRIILSTTTVPVRIFVIAFFLYNEEKVIFTYNIQRWKFH